MSEKEIGSSGRAPAHWEQRYVDAQLPWETGKPDRHLQAAIAEFSPVPGAAVDIGCGTGNNAIWLAQQGFTVHGIDISPTAIEMAKEKVEAAGVACTLEVVNFLEESVSAGPFSFACDRGCFHTFAGAEDQALFVRRVAGLLEPGGMWHSLLGSTDGPPRDTGPPRRSATEIMTAVEPHFEILSLRAVPFDDGAHEEKRGWSLVVRRRDESS